MSHVRSQLRARSLAVPVAIAGAIGLAACGARGPLEVDVIDVYPDAGPTSDASILDAAPEATLPDAAPDATGDDAADGNGNPVVDCVSCVGQMCGTDLIDCLTNTDCRTDVQCIVQMCLTGGTGGFDIGCLGTCTASDPAAGGQAITAFTCILMGCGSQCTSLLGGLGGLGGSGG
jgi:predicted small lipoprotein YifL